MAIIKHLYVIDDVPLGLASGAVLFAACAFAFQAAEESLRHGVVPTVALAAHAALHAVAGQLPPVGLAGVLAPPIAVVDEPRSRAPSPDRHSEGGLDQIGLHRPIHRPAHDSARMQVHQRRQVKPSLPSPQAGDVAGPDSVRLAHRE